MEKLTVKLLYNLPIQVAGGLMGELTMGSYVVEKSRDGWYTIAEGLYEGVEIPRDKCLVIREYVNEIETKLAKAGQELVEERNKHVKNVHDIRVRLSEICARNNIDHGSIKGMIERIGKFIDDTVSVNIANAMKLDGITETLNQIDKEQGGFEVNPEYPIGSMDTIRHVLINWRKEIKRLNEEVFQRDKELKSLRDPIKEPVKVPADVAESLDLLYAENGGNGDWAHSAVMFYSYTTLESEPCMFNPLYIPHLSKVSLWRLGHMDLFADLMKYGYVAEVSKEERMIGRLSSLMSNTETLTIDELAEKIYEIVDESK